MLSILMGIGGEKMTFPYKIPYTFARTKFCDLYFAKLSTNYVDITNREIKYV